MKQKQKRMYFLLFWVCILSSCSNYEGKTPHKNMCEDSDTLHIVRKFVYENGHLSAEEIDYVHSVKPDCFYYGGVYSMVWNFPSSLYKYFLSNKHLKVSFCLSLTSSSINEDSLTFYLYAKKE